MNGNQTALITGATSGIGYELSKLFAGNGYNLVLVARNKSRLDDVASECKRKYSVSATTISKDLSLPSAPPEIADGLRRNSIGVDILVNNAGFNEYGPFLETDLDRELQMIHLHIVALTHLTKLLLPEMTRRNHGKILNIGSTGSFAPGVFNAVYCASKAYILSFSEAIAEELRGTGVSVTTLCPGPTSTEFAQRAGMGDVRIFRGKLMDARAVAEVGFTSLMNGKSTVVPGLPNKLTVFSLRLAPRTLVAKISRSLMSRN